MTMPAPFPHQTTGAEFALSRKASLLAHDMGTGKTRTAIMTADSTMVRRILIVCPTIAVGVWRDQFRLWTRFSRPTQLIRTGRDKPFTMSPSVTIVGYDLLSRSKQLVAMLMEQSYDLIVIDEAHALKERTSKRTKAMYGPACRGNGIVERGGRIILLTGTPMLNHAAELWPHIRALAPHLLDKPNFSDFVDRYCITTSRWIGQRLIERIVGTKKDQMSDLRIRLKPFMDRVRKADVLKDLPPMTWMVWPVTIIDCSASDVPAALIKRFRDADEAAWHELGSKRTEDELLAFLRGSEHMATQRRLCGELKVHAAVKAIREELESSKGKVVVFAHHTAVIDTLNRQLADFSPRVMDGRTRSRDRDVFIEQFQTDPAIRVFIGQNQAAATAISLTASNSVWIIEPDWTPAINAQAAARCHRAGQHDSVTVRVVALEGSIDQAISTVLANKASAIAALIETV